MDLRTLPVVMLNRSRATDLAVGDGRSVGSEEAAAGTGPARVGDVLADAAEPVAVAFACIWGRDRFDEVAEVFVGSGDQVVPALLLY